jgi:acetylornithine deacetylase
VTPVEQEVLDAIDIEAMLGFLCRLIAVPSAAGAESPAQELVARQMERCGLEVDLWPLDFDELGRHPAFCAEIERRRGLGLVGTFGGDGSGHDLIFNGHVDVAPAGELDSWSHSPWQARLTDRRVYGRGAADMKGGLCCALFAAKALRDAGVRLDGRLIVESVIGEEDGGTGTLATLLRGYRADAAIIMEPTELTSVIAHAGALNFRLTVPGRAAHAALREEGISAIEKFLPLFQALGRLERERNRQVRHPLMASYRLPYALSIGTARAGDWPSSVPGRLVCEGRYGIAVGESPAAAKQVFEEAVHRAARTDDWLRDHPPSVDWWGGQFESAEISADHPIVQTVSAVGRELVGREPACTGVPYGADMRLLVNEGGIPTVMFGPGDARVAHGPDEFVPIDELLLAARFLALIGLRFCGAVED